MLCLSCGVEFDPAAEPVSEKSKIFLFKVDAKGSTRLEKVTKWISGINSS